MMESKRKKFTKLIICAIAAGVIVLALLAAYAGLYISFVFAERIECWQPDYEQVDISGILDKETLTADDYTLLYRQTGLTALGIDRTLEYYGKGRVLEIQGDYFKEHTVMSEHFGPFACTDFIEQYIRYAALKDGDIIVTSSTHLSGWRCGHAGLVVNAEKREVLQATKIGDPSAIGYITDFTDRVNFMILSPRVDDDTKAQVVDFAVNNLVGQVYDPTAGVFSSKTNTFTKTQCAHLAWFAYNQFGFDLDNDGGLVVTPQNIANSPEVQIVQVFGFDPIKLWK